MVKLSNMNQVLIILLLSILIFFSVEVGTTNAHTPHDVIDALVISPNFSEDKTVFIIIKNTWVLKSEDGGYSWKWLTNGIDNKFIFTSLSISPFFQVDSTLFLSSKGDGLYKSLDKGISWFKINNGLGSLEIDLLSMSSNYQTDQILLAAGSDGGGYKTKNGGKTWYKVIDVNKKITSIAPFPDAQDNQFLIGDEEGNLYFLTKKDKFKPLSQIQNHGAITSITVSPEFSSDGIFFVGTEKGGVLKTVDRGALFYEVNNGISSKHITSLVVLPDSGEDTTIFASTWNEAVFISNDGGETWKKYDKNLTTDSQADSIQYKSAHFRDISISNTYRKDGTIFLGGFDGLFKSLNGGHSWEQIETMPVHIIKGLSVSPPSGKNFTIGVTTYGGGAYFSEDKGAHWSVNNLGLRTTRLSDIAFSPNYVSDNKVYTASQLYFLISKDKGIRWDRIQPRNESLEGHIYSWLIRLGFSRKWVEKKIFHRTDIHTVWPNVIAISPGFTSDNTIFFGSRYHGIFKSVDSGLNFSNVWDDADHMDRKKVTSLVLSPNFVSDQTLYAGVRYEGIFQSTDGGGTWQRINNGLIFPEENESYIPPYYCLAISPVFQMDNTVFVGTENGLFKTKNGGGKWEELNVVPFYENAYINNIAISPNYANDKTLVTCLKGKGLFKTDDQGETWFEIGVDLKHNSHSIEFVEFSPIYPEDNTILCASRDWVFKSIDSGESWEIIGIPFARYENNRDPLKYEGEWQIERGEGFSATSIHHSDIAGSKASLTFIGTGVIWLGTKSKEQGVARLYIDGDFKANVDQFSNERKVRIPSYSIKDLPYGSHSITIEVTSGKNPNAAGFRIEIDAIDVLK